MIDDEVVPYPGFDWMNPDYGPIERERMNTLRRIREGIKENPDSLKQLKLYYRENPADFINDWGVTYDPRNADIGLPTIIPMILFKKQREWIDAVIAHWRARTPLLTEKSRDFGVSYCAVELGATVCLLYDNVSIGYGSRKREYVDDRGQPKSLFWKARLFLEHLPEEFRGGWLRWRDAPLMRIHIPETGSVMTGEAGDNIGRGDRTSWYVVDEAAHLERPEEIDRSLSQTTNCRIDISSVNGMANPFAQKRWGGKIDVFICDWRDDPRKDAEWYRLLSLPQSEHRADGRVGSGQGLDPITIAQEVDRDYQASVAGIIIPAKWIQASVNALEKLGIAPSGRWGFALDVADEGVDKNAICGGQGVEVSVAEEWGGGGSDIMATTQRAFDIVSEYDATGFRYDADGLGAGVRGDARVINELRKANKQRILHVEAFQSSAAVVDPDAKVEGTSTFDDKTGRTNIDYFQNRKAQGWHGLRRRFYKVYRWVEFGERCPPDEIISLNPKIPNLQMLCSELSQPTWGPSETTGKMKVNKKPGNTKSPNRGDGVMMRYARNGRGQFVVTPDAVAAIQAASMRQRMLRRR